ncbi:MAG: ADP-ribosylation factor-like protein [Candidatus Helarchaeota archaeon]
MREPNERLLKRVRTFFDEDVEVPAGRAKLLSLPCYNLKGITKEVSNQLKAVMGINNIGELAQVDLEYQQGEADGQGWSMAELEGWVLAAKIISKVSSNQIGKKKKIGLIGLQNAGKTAIKEAIFRKYQMDEVIFNRYIQALKPTKGAEHEVFSIFENKLFVWDMGGQIGYRKSYLKNPEKFLLEFSIIIYVIDIRDKQKHHEAIEYLRILVEKFQSLQQRPYFVICFHKLDPNIQDDEYYHKVIGDLSKVLDNIFNKNKLLYRTYVTSIFDDFSLFNFFSGVLNLLIDVKIKKMINQALKECVRETGLSNLILLNENGLKLGEYMAEKNPELYQELYQISLHSMISFRRLNRKLNNKKPLMALFCSFYTENEMNFLLQRIILQNHSLYLTSMHHTQKEIDGHFIVNLMSWLWNLFT